MRQRLTALLVAALGVMGLAVAAQPGAKPPAQVRKRADPLWLRFKVLRGATDPFFLRCRWHLNPADSKQTIDAGWLFKDTVAGSRDEATAMQKDPQRLLVAGKWSPWVKTFPASKRYAYGEITVFPGAGKGNPSARVRGFDHIEMAFQAATRPEETAVVHAGSESTGGGRGVYILLPTAPGLEASRQGVRSFSEWADERLKLVKALGIQAGEGPRRVQVLTMDTIVRTPREIDVFLETCRLLGFNGCDLQQQIVDPQQLWDRIARDGVTWTVTHHVAPAYALKEWLNAPATPPPGQTTQQAVDAFWYDQSVKRIHQIWDKRPEKERLLVDLAILVDEPGAPPKFSWANCIPGVRRCFHDFLRAQGLTPQFFGKQTWDEVDMIGYEHNQRPALNRLLAQMNIELKYIEPAGPVAAGDLLHYEKVPGAKDGRPHYRVQIPIFPGLRLAGPEEKRRYYWSQRFRSFFARHFYGQAARAVEDLAKQGWLHPGIKTTPNFQAAPMMEAQMWDGSLDLFEWARKGASNCLMVEDWINDPYRVGLGLTLLNAAAEKRGQQLAHLITADHHFRRRYLAALALGSRTFVDYLYGSFGVIGPAWMDHPDMVRDRADMLRWTRRTEDDLVASRLRRADTAILIANSSEINTAYYNPCAAETGLKFRAAGGRPLFRRAGIYAALLDGGVPAEVVSETAILDDKMLDRYKALYVTDTHVCTAVQEAIKAWVRNGGTLWADHAALARNEYDENSRVMNEVFGLAERGRLPAPTRFKGTDEEVLRVTSGSVEGPGKVPTAAPAVKQGKPTKATAETIRVAASGGKEQLEEVRFDGSLFRPAWKLSTAQTLATFADGSPALIVNHFGKGQAVLLGCSALALSPYAVQSEANPDFANVRRVALLGAHLAGAARPCRASVPGINSYVRDGANQTVVVLLNSTPAAQRGIMVRLTVPHKVQSAFDGRGNAVPFEQTNDEVKFSRDIALDDGDILVFKW